MARSPTAGRWRDERLDTHPAPAEPSEQLPQAGGGAGRRRATSPGARPQHPTGVGWDGMGLRGRTEPPCPSGNSPPSPGLVLPVRAKYTGAYLWALPTLRSCFLPTEQPGVTSRGMMIFRGLLEVGCFSFPFLASRYILLSWLKAFLCFCGCKRITCVVLTIWQ